MIVLASASPRRKELLSRICEFEVRPSQCDESCDIKDPALFVRTLSERKARAVEGDIVIAADTVVYLNGDILGKPETPDRAREMLRRMSGQTHEVHTGVSVKKDGQVHTFSEKSLVTFYDLADELIEEYVNSGEPMDKAGAYGIQDKGCLLVKKIEGGFFNIMGLPIASLYRLLKELGGI